MISYIIGDIFNSPAQVLVNPVNTVGVMGKGLALSFKQRYPDMFKSYRRACDEKRLKIGRLMIYYAPDHWILLFPTKETWRMPSKIEYIKEGLQRFKEFYADYNITSIAFPKLGCGNGELKWEEVKPIMEEYLKKLPIDIYVYVDNNISSIPEHKTPKETSEWLKQNAKDLSFSGIKEEMKYETAMRTYEFNFNHNKYEVCWRDDFIIYSEKEKIIIQEEELVTIWESIRENGVFKLSKSEKENLIYAALHAFGYLTPIFIEEKGEMIAGYQVNEGANRLFFTKGL